MKSDPLIKRTVTGTVLVAATVSAIYCGGEYVAAFLWLIMNLALQEWARLSRQTGLKIPRFWLYFLANLFYGVLFLWEYSQIGLVKETWVGFSVWSLVLASVVFLALSIFKAGRATSKQVSVVFGGILYIAGSLGLLNYLAAPFHPDGGNVLMGFFLVIWAGDVFAYLVGSVMGRHKLYPKLSPSKTWEGAIGGIFFAALAGTLWGRFFLKEVDTLFWFLVSITASVVAIFGDLLESKIKRDAGVKDSGTLLPGHGGILDRYDSVFLAAPFVVALWNLVSIQG